MTYEIKNNTFHMIHVKVNRDSQCSRALPMKIVIEIAIFGCENIVQGLGLVEDVWKAWSKAEHCIKV